tara:strand:+ start:6807 stop:9950 length:3144 start_codon:yes stop_codon:yes gene_type:complete
MAKNKKKLSVGDIISDIKQTVSLSNQQSVIPDIITFCEDDNYLGFNKQDIHLKDVQKMILKVFYRGSVGNENISLTAEEVELCVSLGLDDEERGDVLGKYQNGKIFRELVLVWGRRSGKDFISSIIALYEAMKLLEIPGGDPRVYYNIAAADINILTIANSQGQATIAFTEIKAKLLASEYFKDKFVKDGLTSLSISLLTPKDKKENVEAAEQNLNPRTKGTVVIEVGHSNSATLLGKGCFVLILDEVASYKNTGGVSSGESIYTSMTPTISTYFRKVPILDSSGNPMFEKNGQPACETIIDGKIISISSPKSKEGKLWDLFSQSGLYDDVLACRIPTWSVVPERTREVLRKAFARMSELDFEMEFGAEFSGIAGENFFSEEYVRKCFHRGIQFANHGEPGQVYFLHLDPAATSHNYALALVHKQIFLNADTQKADYAIIVDMLKYWHPTPDHPVIMAEVDEFVIQLKRYFRIGMVTYDQWNSLESKMRLKKSGIANKETRFTNKHKMIIYDELEQLINAGKIIIPDDGDASRLARDELIALQRKLIPTGYRIGPKRDGDGTKTDDLCVAADTLLYTNTGIKKAICVNAGDRVLTHKGRFKKVEVKYVRESNQLYNLQPYYSFDITATGNHPFEKWSESSGREWADLSLLRRGEYIVKSFVTKSKDFKIDMKKYVKEKVGSHSNIMGKNYDNWDRMLKNESDIHYIRQNNANSKWHLRYVESNRDFGYICGLFLAEGSFTDHGVAFAANILDSSIRMKLYNYLHSVFGNSLKIFVSCDKNGSRGCQFVINSQLVKHLFLDLFGHHTATNKQMCKKLMEAPKEFQAYLLKGMFEGDGTRTKKSLIHKKIFTFTTTSLQLAHQIQLILLRFKVVSSLSISKRKGKHTAFSGRKCPYNADLYNIRICDPGSFNIISKVLGFDIVKEKSKFHKPRYKFIEDNAIVCEIRKNSKIINSKVQVVNFSVQDDHSYVANGINAHNCDALAGACYAALNKNANMLPQSKMVNMGIVPTSNRVTWQGMQGAIGYGSGRQVAEALEKRQPWRLFRPQA